MPPITIQTSPNDVVASQLATRQPDFRKTSRAVNFYTRYRKSSPIKYDFEDAACRILQIRVVQVSSHIDCCASSCATRARLVHTDCRCMTSALKNWEVSVLPAQNGGIQFIAVNRITKCADRSYYSACDAKVAPLIAGTKNELLTDLFCGRESLRQTLRLWGSEGFRQRRCKWGLLVSQFCTPAGFSPQVYCLDPVLAWRYLSRASLDLRVLQEVLCYKSHGGKPYAWNNFSCHGFHRLPNALNELLNKIQAIPTCTVFHWIRWYPQVKFPNGFGLKWELTICFSMC